MHIFLFKQHSNDKEFFMKRKESKFVIVHVICSLSHGDELLINYNLCRQLTACQRRLALGLPLDVPLGCNKNIIDYLYFFYFQMN